MISEKLIRKLLLILGIMFAAFFTKAQILKSIIYDFDGLSIGETDLPEGDYQSNDLSYKVAENPLGNNDMLGDRVLQLNLDYNTGSGTFGRGIFRFIEFDVNKDAFNFYFYNPSSNISDALLDIIITEDDNQNNSYSYADDDAWKKSLSIPAGAGWQLISIPLKDFTDSNPGGNGLFDAAFTDAKGMLLTVEFIFHKNTTGSSVFYLDMICFTDGALPTGTTIFDLPPLSASGKCPLGAFEQKAKDQEYLTPGEIEGLFPAFPQKKLRYVNFFLQFAMDGSTTAKELPGDGIKKLLENGYTPIITWEALYEGYSRLDPVQPRLSNIINGDFNSYIDAFADKIKSYNGNVIIRFLHEFDGDWYPWSTIYNGKDPVNYITAFRKVEDRFKSRGVNNVKWMWCINADYAPYESYNWSVKAYPGDNYIDIVALDIYNNHYPESLPWWMSFRYKTTESYYYLTKYFPQKPLMICEVGCRERESFENQSSQSKKEWIEQMDKELQSNFSKIKGLVFFSANHLGDWRINSSAEALSSVTENIWKDDYYFEDGQISIPENSESEQTWKIFPNPTSGLFIIILNLQTSAEQKIKMKIMNALGQEIYTSESIAKDKHSKITIELDGTIPTGIYSLQMIIGEKEENSKLLLLKK
jgi:hypothetical protein